MAATHALTGNVANAPGVIFDQRQVDVFVLPSQNVTDATTNVSYLGPIKVAVAESGAWSVDLIATNATDIIPAPIGSESFKYRVLIRFVDVQASVRRDLLTGWFDLTADLDFADIDVRTLTQVSSDFADDLLADVAGARDAAIAAAAAAQAVGNTNDTIIAGRINTPGSATATALSASYAEVFKPERFGAVGDGSTDDMAAFQRTTNAIHAAGGGVLQLDAPSYRLGQYTSAAVGGAACGFAVTGTSKCLVLPANVEVRMSGSTTLRLDGGTSSPFGYDLSPNLLAFPGEETSVAVTTVNNLARTAVVASAAGLAVGQVVNLGRVGGVTGSLPNTPSLERAPHQFLTIAAIAGTTITFVESFLHDFASTQNLQVFRPTQGDYPANIAFTGHLEIEPYNGGDAYVLFTRARNVSFDDLLFRDVSYSFGMSQTIRGGLLRHITATRLTMLGTSESTSDVKIDVFEADGGSSDNLLGALFVDDNSRSVQIGKYIARRFTKTGLAALYGVDLNIGLLHLIDCATDAPEAGTFAAALTVGIPPQGAYASLAAANADAYKRRNLGPTAVKIGRLLITGACQQPIRCHDADLTIDDADIDFANTGGRSPVLFGQSLERRADAVFPAGGEGSINYGDLRVHVVSGAAPAAPISVRGGMGGVMRGADTTLTAAALASATTVVVADPSQFKVGGQVYLVNLGGSSVAATNKSVTAIAGSTLTLDAPIGFALANGQGIWRDGRSGVHTRKIKGRRLSINGVEQPSINGEATRFPALAGSGPYTYPAVLHIPGPGEWILHISATNNAFAHRVTARYLVAYDATNATYPICGISSLGKLQVRSSIDIASTSAADSGDVTVTITSTSSDTPVLTTRWEPLARTDPGAA